MQPEEGAALSCTGLDWSQLRCNLSLNQIQIRTPPGYHSSLAWPDVLLCDLESGLNLSGGSLRRRAPAFRFGPYCPPPATCDFLSCPSLGSSRLLSCFLVRGELQPLALAQPLWRVLQSCISLGSCSGYTWCGLQP